MISKPAGKAARLILHPGDPNPFREATTLSFELPELNSVTLSIFDQGGRLLRTILNASYLKEGSYSCLWDGRDEKGRRVPPGDYFVRLELGSMVESRKLTLLGE